MSIWSPRTEALSDPHLAQVHTTLENGFELVDQGLKLLEARIDDHDLARIAGVFLLKGKNLALGCYSLTLDGLAQESGALLRTLVEVVEMAQYLRKVPDGVSKVQNDRAPAPGKRAALVESSFHSLRQHLNEHASHLALSAAACRHLVHFREGKTWLVTSQKFVQHVARTNLITLGAFLVQLVQELLLCVDAVRGGCPPELIDSAEAFRTEILRLDGEA